MTLRGFLARYGTALGGLLVFIVFAATADNFLAVENLLNITKHISFITVLAIGLSMALERGQRRGSRYIASVSPSNLPVLIRQRRNTVIPAHVAA